MTDTESLPQYTRDRLLQIAGLATATMLHEDRLQPGPDQQPAGCYWNNHSYVIVYERSGAVAMPPMSPGRQQLYDARRTCAECGRRSKSPWYQGPDGQANRVRYCPDCLELVWRRLWEEQQASRRAAATAWAHQMLTHPTTAVLAANTRGWCTMVHAETTTGEVLLDLAVRMCTHNTCDHDAQAVPPGAVTPAEAGPTIQAALADRRLITWSSSILGRVYRLDPNTRALAATSSVYDKHWSNWVGERDGGPDASYRYHHTVSWQPPRPLDAIGQVAEMRAGLNEMASGADPAPEPHHG